MEQADKRSRTENDFVFHNLTQTFQEVTFKNFIEIE